MNTREYAAKKTSITTAFMTLNVDLFSDATLIAMTFKPTLRFTSKLDKGRFKRGIFPLFCETGTDIFFCFSETT